jgi:recombination protein RecA
VDEMSNLSDVIKELNKKYKQNLIVTGSVSYNLERIPFSSPRANYMTHGGIPLGRVVELFGEENGGKTTTSLDIVKNAQIYFKKEWQNEMDRLNNSNKLSKEQIARQTYLEDRGPRAVVWIDAENTFDDTWASLLGVDVSKLIKMVPQEQYAEELFEMALELLNTGDVGLMVLDSLGILMSKQQMEKNIEDKTYGGIAMALTRFSKELCMVCGKTNSTFIGINQLRDDMNSMYGGTTTPGGKAWKHHCSLRIEFRKGSLLDDKYKEVPKKTENPYGNKVCMQIKKTKVCKPDRLQGDYTLVYNTGIDEIHDLIDICVDKTVINKAGAWFTFMHPTTGEILTRADGEVYKVQGESGVRKALESDDKLLNIYRAYVDSLVRDVTDTDIQEYDVYDEEAESVEQN